MDSLGASDKDDEKLGGLTQKSMPVPEPEIIEHEKQIPNRKPISAAVTKKSTKRVKPKPAHHKKMK